MGPCFGDPAVLEDDHPVGQHEGVEDVVGDDDGPAVGEDALEQPAQQRGRMDVQGGHRFVEQQQLGVGGQGAGHGDPLGLAAGELAGAPVPRGRSASTSASQCRRRFAGRGPGGAGAAGPERDVVQRRSGAGTAAAPGPAAPMPRGVRGAPEFLPAVEVEEDLVADRGLPGVGAQQAGDDREQR